jgi:hypothetical protein
MAWKAVLRTGATPEELTQARENYSKAVLGKSLEYVKYPAGFLRKDFWRDHLDGSGSPAAGCPACGEPLEYGHCYNGKCPSQVPAEVRS